MPSPAGILCSVLPYGFQVVGFLLRKDPKAVGRVSLRYWEEPTLMLAVSLMIDTNNFANLK